MLPVSNDCDPFLGPTKADADVNSLRSALHLGVDAIASDAVMRLDESIIFRIRNIDNVEGKVGELLNSKAVPEKVKRRVRYQLKNATKNMSALLKASL